MEKLNDQQRKIIEENYKLIPYFYQKSFASMLEYEEYLGLAHEAICKAVRNYKPEKGTFSTLYFWQLRSRISHYFRVSNYQKRKINKETISLDTPLRDFPELTLASVLSDTNDILDPILEMERWKEKIKKQPEKRQKIIFLRLIGYEQKEIAEKLNISRQAVSSQLMAFKKYMGY